MVIKEREYRWAGGWKTHKFQNSMKNGCLCLEFTNQSIMEEYNA